MKKIAQAVLLPENEEKFSDLSIVLVEPEKIREINKKYRKKDEPTDVLSFPDLKEIYICPLVIRRQAKMLKIPFRDELTRVVAHGILHLLGFDHLKKKEAAEMEKKENDILKKISER